MQRYSQDFKEQVVKECREVGNAALVARRHNLSKNTVHTWLKTSRAIGSTTPLPRAKEPRIAEMEQRIRSISTENDQLKRLVAEKELELAILRDLRDKTNPR